MGAYYLSGEISADGWFSGRKSSAAGKRHIICRIDKGIDTGSPCAGSMLNLFKVVARHTSLPPGGVLGSFVDVSASDEIFEPSVPRDIGRP
jgi:hypothetical protein